MNIWTTYTLSAASATQAASDGAADNVPRHCHIFIHDERHRELALRYELWCHGAIPRKPLFPHRPAARPIEPRNAGGIANESRRMGNEPTASGSMSSGTPSRSVPKIYLLPAPISQYYIEDFSLHIYICIAYALSAASATQAASSGAADNVPSHILFFIMMNGTVS